MIFNKQKYRTELKNGEFNKKLNFLLIWTPIILSYLFVEWIYNQHLLSLLSIENIQPDKFYYTEIFGKVIASVGLNLIIKEIFRYNGWLGFIIGTLIGYFLLTFLFTYLIHSFSDEFKHTSYYTLKHRQEVLVKKDSNQLLENIDSDKWFVKPIFMSYFILQKDTLNLQKTIQESQKVFLDKLEQFNSKKETYWQNYQKAMKARESLSNSWTKYQSAMFKYNQYKYTKYKNKAYSEFKRLVGMEPNLTENQFYDLNGKSYIKFLNTEFLPGLSAANIAPIYGKDVPTYFNEQDFYSYVKNKINFLQFKVAPNVNEMTYHSLGKDAVSLFVIPPISIGLSLFSILLNLIFLISMWLYLCVYYTIFSPKKVLLFYFFITVLLFSVSYCLLPNHLTSYKKWEEPVNKFSEQNIFYHFFINFTLKFEPLICFDTENNKIKETTYKIYKNQ